MTHFQALSNFVKMNDHLALLDHYYRLVENTRCLSDAALDDDIVEVEEKLQSAFEVYCADKEDAHKHGRCIHLGYRYAACLAVKHERR